MSLCFESSAGTPAVDGAGTFLALIFSVVVQVHVRAGERDEALYRCDANHENSKQISDARPCEQARMQERRRRKTWNHQALALNEQRRDQVLPKVKEQITVSDVLPHIGSTSSELWTISLPWRCPVLRAVSVFSFITLSSCRQLYETADLLCLAWPF